MNQQAIKNLNTVRAEVQVILNNIEEVKGTRYRTLLSALLLTNNLVEITGTMEHFCEADPETLSKLRDTFINILHCQLSELLSLARVKDKDVEQAMLDATRIGESMHGMAHRAVNAALTGKKFGDQ